jgi:uncharacterized protein YdeI (YjbR/CyaY-like superfamily)
MAGSTGRAKDRKAARPFLTEHEVLAQGDPTNPEVDPYINTSQLWPKEMCSLRPILLVSGLTEELKWCQPASTHHSKNIVTMGRLKAGLTLGFYKGTLLSDTDGVLKDNGPNSRSARRMYFTSVVDVQRPADTITRYIAVAILVEESGLTVGPAPELALVAELQSHLDSDANFSAAFESLTPGRQREYNLHISAAKQSATREARIQTFLPKIMNGKGMRGR